MHGYSKINLTLTFAIEYFYTFFFKSLIKLYNYFTFATLNQNLKEFQCEVIYLHLPTIVAYLYVKQTNFLLTYGKSTLRLI